MRTTDLFTIDGKPVLVPDGDLAFSAEDMESSDSGWDENGIYHRYVLRRNVQSWDFSYSRLSREEYAYMEGLFGKKDTFTFGFISPHDGARQNIIAYRSKHSILWHCAADGQFRDYRFRITTC